MSILERIDHRRLAEEITNLYFYSKQTCQGMPILLPNYTFIYKQIKNLIQQKWIKYNFQETITPILGEQSLYQTSEHLEKYKEGMFPPINYEQKNYYLRAMTCPHHCIIYQQKRRTYKELPLRIAENSRLFRHESSGSLKGLERVRCFEIADQHIFTDLANLKKEIKKNYYFIKEILTALEIHIDRLVLSLHDPEKKYKYHNDKETWNKTESLLKNIIDEIKIDYSEQKGQAAFYGPKLDIEIKTNDGKYSTIATIQLDFLLPQKFKLYYLDKKQKKQIPILIHQSPIGSYERCIALLIEQKQGKLPIWLVPCQLAILPINETSKVIKYCKEITKKLTNWRTKIFSKKTLQYRIKQLYQQKIIPYYLIIGNQEIEQKQLTLNSIYQNWEKKISLINLNKILSKSLNFK